jgi:hypothetical protein
MAVVDIDFEWKRSTKGYRVVASKRREPQLVYHPLGIRVTPSFVVDTPLRIVPRRGKLEVYRPSLDDLSRIFVATVKTKTREVLNFVEKFGPLTDDGLNPKIGESTYEALVHAEAMREFLAYASNDARHVVAAQSNQSSLSNISASLVFDPMTSRPKIRLKPASLLDAMWLQLGQKVSGDAVIRECKHCGEWFEVGAGTGRRLDAKFCSDKHKITFNSLKRSRREGDDASDRSHS